ncbi:hypothetical protein DSO57_1015595 [Entomophthora muscae]|uniref:Uncharacterized protein n=1 Tax=Entomophthora muscae TaxID=34485 RepID=A0ACC2SHT7_9FUNG|nr:hypothetical protein DSO57_1015595 [Entomophthora muscae]
MAFQAQPASPVGVQLESGMGSDTNIQTNHFNSSTSDATGQSSQFMGVLYLALTGLIDSALPAAGPWAVAGKALSYLIKLGPIIWWAMPVPALTPPSSAGAPWYSWYPGKHSPVQMDHLKYPTVPRKAKRLLLFLGGSISFLALAYSGPGLLYLL